MGDIYSKSFALTTNSYDCFDRIKPSTFADLMQNTAGEHADVLGVGFDDFIKQDYIWVIVRNYMEIYSYRKNIKNVEVTTSICKPRLFECPREFVIKDLDTNEIIMRSRTSWVIFDLKTKSIVDPSKFEGLITTSKGELPRVKRLEKTNEKEYEYVKDFMVTYSMIDHNKHMNNTRALDVFLDVFRLKENEVIKNIQIEYELQAYLDNLLSLYKKIDGDKYSLFSKIDSEFWRIDANILKI